MLKRSLSSILCILVFCLAWPGLARAETPTPSPFIQFGQTMIIYELPERYIFEVEIHTPYSQPVGGFFTMYYARDDRINHMIEIDARDPNLLQFSVDADSFFVFPFVPIHVQWSVSDDQGHFEISEEEEILGEDPRFEWQELKNDALSLHLFYHDRSDNFGEQVFSAAEEATRRMEADFGVQPATPIQVLVYNDRSELQDYLYSFGVNVGGQAFPRLGITFQLIPATFGMSAWIEEVIPHEISHLYFFQATGGDKSNMLYEPPDWLNEGLAEISAYGLDQDRVETINWQLRNAEWLPTLQYLNHDFGMIAGQSDLEYAVSYSVTCYLIDQYGEESLAGILSEYRDGARTEDAFTEVLGIGFTDLAREWRAASGLPLENKTAYPPTPAPTPTGLPTPSPEELRQISAGLLAGIGASCLCGTILLAIIVVAIILLTRKKKAPENLPGGSPANPQEQA